MPRKVLETELKIPKISSNVENTTVRSPSGASASVTTPKTPNHAVITPVTDISSDVRKRLSFHESASVSVVNKRLKTNDFKVTEIECTPKSKPKIIKPKGILNIQSFEFTPAFSVKTLAANTPVNRKESDVRKRLDLFNIIPEHPNFIAELQKFKLLPNCLCAIGCLFNLDAHKDDSRSTVLDKMPDFFGYYKGSNCIKSFARLRQQLKEINYEFRSAAATSFSNCYEQHLSMQGMQKDDNCIVCSRSDTFANNLSELQSHINKFYTSQLGYGQTLDDIFTEISKCNKTIFAQFLKNDKNSSSNVSNDSFEVESQKIRENLDLFQKNLDDHSARLYYATPIPHRQIVALDQNLFCQPKTVYKNAEEIFTLIPHINKVKSSVPDLDFGLILADYENHIGQFGSEQRNFLTSLAKKYQLKGFRGGCSRKIECLQAQTVVLHQIKQLQLEHPVRYNKLFREFESGYRKRAKLEQFELYDNLKIPRLPRKKMALQQVENLIKNKDILIGQPQQSQKVMSTHPVSGEIIEIELSSRKVSFDDLRGFTLHKHKKYLRAKEPSFYKCLKKDEILKKLNDYGILESEHKTMDEVKLQNFVQKLETTRNIAIWYDHATIGNRSHVLFTFQLIYNKATYVNPPGIKIDDMQKEIEIPQIYMLGISKGTTKSERSFDDMRLDDVLSLSNPVKLDNIIFKDSFKISFGDNPVRCSEMGQNKSGRYRVCSLPLNIDEFHSFKDLLSHKHLTINEKRAIACKGNFFDSDDRGKAKWHSIRGLVLIFLQLLKYESEYIN